MKAYTIMQNAIKDPAIKVPTVGASIIKIGLWCNFYCNGTQSSINF